MLDVRKKACKVIACAHDKGGVGKTTTTANILFVLSKNGFNVLGIDADPQGDLSKFFGIKNPHSLEKTLASGMNAVIEEKSFDPTDFIQHNCEGVDFIPANAELAATETTLVNSMNREYVMQEFIKPFRPYYDYILIDCRPSLGLTVVNALTAADSLIIPVQAHKLAAEDMDGLFKTVGRIKQRPNPALKVDGIIMTMVDSRTTLAWKTIHEVQSKYGNLVRVFDTKIPFGIKAAEIPGDGKSIFTYAPNSKVAKAYEQLTKEVQDIGKLERKAKNSDAR